MSTKQRTYRVPRRDAADEPRTVQVMRTDRGALLGSKVDSNGVLHVEAIVAVPGIMEYRMPDGSVIRELLDADVLTRAEDLATLGRAVVTNDHPDEDVTPAHWRKLSVGDLDGEVEYKDDYNDGFVRVKAAVRDAQAIADVQGGKREVSPGYMATIDTTPGEHPVFGRYDSKQLARDYNHLAIVDKARGGHDVRLRADGAGVATRSWKLQDGPGGEPEPKPKDNDPVPSKQEPVQGDLHMDRIIQILLDAQNGTITFDQARTAISKHSDAKMTDIERDAVQKALDALEKQLAAADKKVADMQATIDAFEAEAKTQKEAKDAAETDEAKQERADAERKARLDAFKARTELLAFLDSTDIEIEDVEKKDDAEIVEAIVRDRLGDKVPVEPHDTYFETAFDVIKGGAVAKKDTKELEPPKGLNPFTKDGKIHEDGTKTPDPYAVQAKNVRDAQEAARS